MKALFTIRRLREPLVAENLQGVRDISIPLIPRGKCSMVLPLTEDSWVCLYRFAQTLGFPFFIPSVEQVEYLPAPGPGAD